MNTNLSVRTRFAALLPVLLLLLTSASPAFSQRGLTIPARSASTTDDDVSGNTTTPPVVPVAPLNSSLSGNSSLSRAMVPTSPPGQGNIESQSTPVSDPALNTNVTAVQRVDVTPPPMDVATIKRLAELRKELRVAESATKARINLPSDDLFPSDDNSRIDPLAEPVLAGVVEYLERTLKKNVTIKVLYVPGEPSAKEAAWSRALVLIDWLRQNSSLDPNLLKASAPEELTKETPKANATSIGETEFVSRMELHLE